MDRGATEAPHSVAAAATETAPLPDGESADGVSAAAESGPEAQGVEGPAGPGLDASASTGEGAAPEGAALDDGAPALSENDRATPIPEGDGVDELSAGAPSAEYEIEVANGVKGAEEEPAPVSGTVEIEQDDGEVLAVEDDELVEMIEDDDSEVPSPS